MQFVTGPKRETTGSDLPRYIAAVDYRAYASFMPEAVEVASQKSGSSFANLLASFTRKLQDDEWDDSALADDVAPLSYEEALRATRRTRAPETAAIAGVDDLGASLASASSEQKSVHGVAEKQHRSASITIRVTAEERARLHERATAAQLSVSAYLRSCIFEAESLRSQVKEALAQMQSVHDIAGPYAPNRPRGWRSRFFPAWTRARTGWNLKGEC